ncbi:gig2-like protein [Stylonychia lemnae]|uniref:Gig2-like protein n=1 Tax=Stylonychia lemnae TaxID=5949 RepID=A0A078ADQ2_STYLE|nr:gig2-like protein [Stylonychia lemnae]|eukprot:CDW80360.1 gig2-like protein [Stylonychia lemnae]
MNQLQASCRISECKKNHALHYCNICENKNSDHLPRNCPHGIEVFHGTAVQNIPSILENGLQPSTNGTLGRGIYFAKGIEALQISVHRGDGSGFAVFKCKVNPKYCKTSVHPQWQGVTNSEFQEWCLQDCSKYAFVGLFLIQSIVKGVMVVGLMQML